MRLKLRLTFVVLSIITAGCTQVSSHSQTFGKRRPPIDPSLVQIYKTPPWKYEVVAKVSAMAGHDFRTANGILNSAIEELKREAAKVGANGLMVEDVRERRHHVGYTYVDGIAIFVIEKTRPRNEREIVWIGRHADRDDDDVRR